MPDMQRKDVVELRALQVTVPPQPNDEHVTAPAPTGPQFNVLGMVTPLDVQYITVSLLVPGVPFGQI